MRIYGRENSAVVKPTKAVSATRNTLNGSTKNCPSSASSGPSAITRLVSSAAAARVTRLAAALASGAQRMCPTSASSTAPATGMTSTSAISKSVCLQLFHMLDVEAVELLADMEKEDAEDERAHQHVERHPQFDHQRHAVGGARGGEKQTVLHGEQTDPLRHGFSANDHHEEGKQDARHRDPQGRAPPTDRKSTRLNSSHEWISYAVFCL